MLSADEVARLEAGLPRLAGWGEHLLVPFRARRLRAATVAWLNERWFVERGVDVVDPATRSRACAWLLDELAWTVPTGGDPDGAHADEERIFFADRYGGSGMVPHGGSGRAGLAGCFQVKGIGPTPLVGGVASWAYSHGCAWLEEALREAIAAEVAAAEMPHGAVPVIAVIDAGMRYRMPGGQPGERRALLVSPAALRPAHAERAPLFRRARDGVREVDTSDTSDVERARAVLRWLDERAGDAAAGVAVAGWVEHFTRVAEQVGAGHVHRLCHGGYLTSNISVNGELLDFGSFRAVPDWSKAFPLDNMPGFGDELLLLVSAIRSIAFLHRKYRAPGAPALSEQALLVAVTRALQARFDHECLRVWAVDDVEDAALRAEVIGAMRGYFAAQQAVLASYQRGFAPAQPWIGDEVARGPAPPDPEPTLERRILGRIDAALAAHFGEAGRARRELAWLTAARLLQPRPALHREELQGRLYERLGGSTAGAAPDPDALAAAVDELLSLARRDWPLLPRGLAAAAQVVTGPSSALLCRDVAAEAWCLWVEGARHEGRVRLFDRSLPLASLSSSGALTGRRWGGLFLVVEDHRGDLELRIPGDLFRLPAPDRWRTVGSLDLGGRLLVVAGHRAGRPGQPPDQEGRAEPGQADRRGRREGRGAGGRHEREQAGRP